MINQFLFTIQLNWNNWRLLHKIKKILILIFSGYKWLYNYITAWRTLNWKTHSTDLDYSFCLKQIALSKKNGTTWVSMFCWRAQWQQFSAGMKPPDLIKAAGLALQIHKAKMMFERKARRERHAALPACPLLHYSISSLQDRDEGARRGAQRQPASPGLSFPLGKRCITENPVHLRSRHAAMLWSSFAYFIIIIFKKKMCTSVWWCSGLQRKVCFGFAVSEQLFSLKLAKWAIRGRIIKDWVLWPEEDPGAILRFFGTVVNERGLPG